MQFHFGNECGHVYRPFGAQRGMRFVSGCWVQFLKDAVCPSNSYGG